jgi:sugar-specific transcriptional regulator TrmB
MNKEHLQLFLKAGLTEEQSKVYDALLKIKSTQASKISRLCEIERSFAYKVLNQLVAMKLAQKQETKGQVTTFTAEHPQRIIELAEERRVATENSYRQIETGIGEVISSYNLTIEKPNVQFMEGSDNLERLHKDIIKTGGDIKIFRSHIDKVSEKSKALIDKQIKTRVSEGLKTKVIGPLPGTMSRSSTTYQADVEKLKKEDASLLVDRRIIDNFEIPAQILIYGNKVAITDYKNNVVTTIIENESVREAFEKIFDYTFSIARKL